MNTEQVRQDFERTILRSLLIAVSSLYSDLPWKQQYCQKIVNVLSQAIGINVHVDLLRTYSTMNGKS